MSDNRCMTKETALNQCKKEGFQYGIGIRREYHKQLEEEKN